MDGLRCRVCWSRSRSPDALLLLLNKSVDFVRLINDPKEVVRRPALESGRLAVFCCWEAIVNRWTTASTRGQWQGRCSATGKVWQVRNCRRMAVAHSGSQYLNDVDDLCSVILPAACGDYALCQTAIEA